MTIKRRQLFPELEPPPGGAARLRAMLGSSTERRSEGNWWLGPAAVGAIALIAVIALRSVPTVDPASATANLMAEAAFDRLLGRESEPFELTVSRGSERIEVSQLTSGNPRVRLYRFDVVPAETE